MTSIVRDAELTLDALDLFLNSGDAPPNAMGLSELDGFLIGIAIGPEPIPPGEWLREVWGGDEPLFRTSEAEETVRALVFSRYSEILSQLSEDPEQVLPTFWQDAEGEVLAEDWAAGFLAAIDLRADAWGPLLTSRRDYALIMPILSLCVDEDGEPLLPLDSDEDFDVAREMFTKMIPGCISAIYYYWQIQIVRSRNLSPPVKSDKTGRNDPCPCASGRKFKRCCGSVTGAGMERSTPAAI